MQINQQASRLAGSAPPNAPQPTTLSTLINDALNRVASLAKNTAEIAYILGHREGAQGESAAKSTDNPSITDRLFGLHQLLELVETNVANIGQRIV